MGINTLLRKYKTMKVKEVVKKPKCKLADKDGNVFNLIGIGAKALRKAGQVEQAKAMTARIFGCGSYGEALNIMGEYLDIY